MLHYAFADLPKEGPTITGEQTEYQIGDTLNINCTSGRSHPYSSIQWFINDEPVRIEECGRSSERVQSNAADVSWAAVELLMHASSMSSFSLTTSMSFHFQWHRPLPCDHYISFFGVVAVGLVFSWFCHSVSPKPLTWFARAYTNKRFVFISFFFSLTFFFASFHILLLLIFLLLIFCWLRYINRISFIIQTLRIRMDWWQRYLAYKSFWMAHISRMVRCVWNVSQVYRRCCRWVAAAPVAAEQMVSMAALTTAE